MKIRRLLLFLLIFGVSCYFFYPQNAKTGILPVLFKDAAFHPLVKVTFDEKNYLFEVDTGAAKKLYLKKEFLKNIPKETLSKTNISYDFRGNAYSNPVYIVPSCQIGPFLLNECEIIEECETFHKNTHIWDQINRGKINYHGRLGLKFFESHSVLIDFPNSAIYVGEDLQDLIKNQFLKTENFHPVPLQRKNGIIYALVKTDLGMHKLAFDTGSSFCILNKKHVLQSEIKTTPSGNNYIQSKHVYINECDFLDWDFAITDFSDQFGIDGLIGVDFFLEYAVCFDFKNNMAYIQKPKGILGTQWKRGKFYVTQFFTKLSSEFSHMEDL